MGSKFFIEDCTNKILISGDRNNPLISAIMSLPKFQRKELEKVINLTLFDGYPLTVKEWSALDLNWNKTK